MHGDGERVDKTASSKGDRVEPPEHAWTDPVQVYEDWGWMLRYGFASDTGAAVATWFLWAGGVEVAITPVAGMTVEWLQTELTATGVVPEIAERWAQAEFLRMPSLFGGELGTHG